jgi:tetratricopeptide (TPR) repeat protein
MSASTIIKAASCDDGIRSKPCAGRHAYPVNEGYTLHDVRRLLGLPRSIVRGLIEAGFVSPLRGPRREYRFSFQDLVVLRAAQALVEAKLPTTRILRSLRRLRAQLPAHVPLSGFRVEAVGDAMVVRDGNGQWQPDNGQYVLRFQVASTQGGLAFLAVPATPAPSAHALLEQAAHREASNPDEACSLYRRAVAADPALPDGYTNLGRLLHERKRFSEAEAAYREGLLQCGRDATLLFNLALLLEDLERTTEAAGAYRQALDADPGLADAHYNLALLCEAAGLQQEAIRHFAAYRKLGDR